MSSLFLWSGLALILIAFLGWLMGRMLVSCAPWCVTRMQVAEVVAIGVLIVGVAGVIALVVGAVLKARGSVVSS